VCFVEVKKVDFNQVKWDKSPLSKKGIYNIFNVYYIWAQTRPLLDAGRALLYNKKKEKKKLFPSFSKKEKF